MRNEFLLIYFQQPLKLMLFVTVVHFVNHVMSVKNLTQNQSNII